MENTLYYTFSTIAQSLAGALALLGAFVLYRVQNIDRDLQDSMNLIADSWYEDEKFKLAFSQGDVRAFFAEVAARLAAPLTVGWSHRQQSNFLRAQRLLTVRDELLRSVRLALWFPAAVMCSSVAVLSCVTYIASLTRAPSVVLALGVMAFTVSIGVFVRFITRILNSASA